MSTSRTYRSDLRADAARETRRRILATAERQLLAGGYHAMTISTLARAADVSPQTIYNAIGGKAAVVKALYDERLSGDDEPVPFRERPEFRRVLTQPDAPSTVRAYAAAGRLLYDRVGTLLGAVLAEGPGNDADLRDFVATMEAERRAGNAMFVRHVHSRFGLPANLSTERAIDLVWTITAFELTDRLVRRCGWRTVDVGRWVGDVLVAALCP